jgi:hypothetical protein
MTKPPKYWFPAKTYGWGWGPPNTWQGWVILAGFGAILVVAGLLLLPIHPISFLVVAVAISGLLTFICYLTGEPPGWRWGK